MRAGRAIAVGDRMGRGGRAVGPACHSGFTVVELVTALALTAAALTLTYSTFRLALNAQERGMSRMDMLQRADSALDVLARDLRSAINLGNEGDYLFESTDNVEGDVVADTLGFVATVNNPRTQTRLASDLARIEYYLDFDPDTPEMGLVRRQLSFPIPEDEEQRDADARTTELLPTAESFSILLYDNTTREWVENWDEMQGIPGAVKIELVMSMAREQTDEEKEESEQAPEMKPLTLLVHLPASRYTPSEPEELAEELQGPAEEEEGPERPGSPEAPGPQSPFQEPERGGR